MLKYIIIDSRYVVIDYKWDDAMETKMECVIGSFDQYADALLFKNTYNEYWGRSAKISNH